MYYMSKTIGRMLDIIFFVLTLLSQINIGLKIQQLRNYIIYQLVQIEKDSNKKIVDIPNHIIRELCCLYTIRRKFPECIICFENLCSESITITGCGHVLCKICRSKIYTCPLCRLEIEKISN